MEPHLLVVDEAAKRKAYSTDQRVFMWAALLHDIGKPASTRLRKGRITAYNHDKNRGQAVERLP
jgi:putative nucleotidyltransferase with HDIG domain